MIDTHAHLYLEAFEEDRTAVIERSRAAGINEVWLPGIDADSLPSMEALNKAYPGYFKQFAGLHPCDVKPGFSDHLQRIKEALDTGSYAGIGEIGLDLYWDKTYLNEQLEALRTQLDWAVAMQLPVILHVRDAYEAIMPVIRTYYGSGLRGIFHSYAGSLEEAIELTNNGFLLGINGSITFKKSQQAAFLHQLPLTSLVTETDAPYLAPVPHRGKRNEPANIPLVIDFIAQAYGLPVEKVRTTCLANAQKLLNPTPISQA
ncbi:MAG: TatD family hydrolase [Bacteroidales bacterium]|jgi:TatD DNase family protein|nr:TatD family hydrolase [Bacteroidales bacterium]